MIPRPPDHSIFINEVQKNCSQIQGVVIAVGNKIQKLSVGDKVLVEKKIDMIFDGIEFSSVGEFHISMKL